MRRTCDGTDRYLEAADGTPCRCGLTFDDVERVVIYPHRPILSQAERHRLMREFLRNQMAAAALVPDPANLIRVTGV